MKNIYFHNGFIALTSKPQYNSSPLHMILGTITFDGIKESHTEKPPNRQFGTKQTAPRSSVSLSCWVSQPGWDGAPCCIPRSQCRRHCLQPHIAQAVGLSCKDGLTGRGGCEDSAAAIYADVQKEIYAFRLHLLSPSVWKVKYKPRDQSTQNSEQMFRHF